MSRLEPGDAVPHFALRNAGPGLDPLSLEALQADPQVDRALLLFQRDFHCTNCAKQVRDVADKYEAFLEAGTLVISILPESYERTRNWQQKHELPFPVLADPDTTVSDEFDQPVRFGFLGQFSDFLGRMPQAVLLDLTADPRVVGVHRGRSTWDRPDMDGLLEMGSETGEE